jgi:hypothetical protein
MRKSRVFFCLFLVAIGSYAVFAASGWTFKAKLFPLSVSIPLIVLVATELVLQLFGKKETTGGPAADLDFTADVPPEVARQRVIGTFLWIAGFILLVYLVGFPVAVPVFIFSYLKLHSRVDWRLSCALTGVTWLFFYSVFQWLLHLRFEEGLIQTWLGL